MSAVAEVIVRARHAFLFTSAHRLGGMLLVESLLLEAAGGNGALAHDALCVLDAAVPGDFTFGLFVDGAAWAGDEMVFAHDRSAAEIAKVFNRAYALARRGEVA